MKEILLNNAGPKGIFYQLQTCLNGELNEVCGERIICFDSALGKGTIKTIDFDWGVSLMNCDVSFTEPIKVVFDTPDVSSVEFIFISNGNLQYSKNEAGSFLDLEQFQNIIIAPKRKSQKTLLFPQGINLRINLIQIVCKEYLKKKNNNIYYLNDMLIPLFLDTPRDKDYLHEGSYSLQIADEIKYLTNLNEGGMFRTLLLEGKVYYILALQLLEYQNCQVKVNLPQSITKTEISKIQKLTDYIQEHISENISMNVLSSESGLSPNKLQLGFKVLFSTTVNEYIRQIKLAIARDYLKNTDLSVSEIVYSIGITSRSYFSKIFFEAFTMLPTEYRKLLKQDHKFVNPDDLSR